MLAYSHRSQSAVQPYQGQLVRSERAFVGRVFVWVPAATASSTRALESAAAVARTEDRLPFPGVVPQPQV